MMWTIAIVLTIQKQNQYIGIQDGSDLVGFAMVGLVLECHSKSEPFTEQLWTIQNPNVFGIQELTVFLRQSVLS